MFRRDLVNKLGLDGPCHRLTLTGVGGVNLPSTMEKRVKFQLQDLSGTYTSHPIEAVTKEKLTEKMREIRVNPSEFPHLRGIHFADEVPRQTVDVDILIGCDLFGSMMTGKIIKGREGEPVVTETLLGYVLSGTA